MPYREIIAVCTQIHTKHISTLCGQNVELLNVKPCEPFHANILWTNHIHTALLRTWQPPNWSVKPSPSEGYRQSINVLTLPNPETLQTF